MLIPILILQRTRAIVHWPIVPIPPSTRAITSKRAAHERWDRLAGVYRQVAGYAGRILKGANPEHGRHGSNSSIFPASRRFGRYAPGAACPRGLR